MGAVLDAPLSVRVLSPALPVRVAFVQVVVGAAARTSGAGSTSSTNNCWMSVPGLVRLLTSMVRVLVPPGRTSAAEKALLTPAPPHVEQHDGARQQEERQPTRREERHGASSPGAR